MARNGTKWLQISRLGMALFLAISVFSFSDSHFDNGMKWLEMARNGKKWQEIARNGQKWLQSSQLGMTPLLAISVFSFSGSHFGNYSQPFRQLRSLKTKMRNG